MEQTTAKALVVAVGKYDHHEELPKAVAAASELADKFQKAGFAVDGRSLIGSGNKTALDEKVGQWLGNTSKDERLVLFWTGHGVSDATGQYLIASNSPQESEISGLNAVKAAEIGTAISKSKAEKILVVLDTCYSGQGPRRLQDRHGQSRLQLQTLRLAPGAESASLRPEAERRGGTS
jgi:Caspase domain